jgi:hypothetical protein
MAVEKSSGSRDGGALKIWEQAYRIRSPGRQVKATLAAAPLDGTLQVLELAIYTNHILTTEINGMYIESAVTPSG